MWLRISLTQLASHQFLCQPIHSSSLDSLLLLNGIDLQVCKASFTGLYLPSRLGKWKVSFTWERDDDRVNPLEDSTSTPSSLEDYLRYAMRQPFQCGLSLIESSQVKSSCHITKLLSYPQDVHVHCKYQR
jgi:hypothetical protein